MIKTYTPIETLILSELKRKMFPNIRDKDFLIIYNDIKIHHEISFEEFSEGIQSLVNKKLLIFNVSDSGIKFYELSDELKSMLDIE